MACFVGALGDPVFMIAAAISALAAFVMLWMARHQDFSAKRFYSLTCVGVVWTLLAVGLEAASDGAGCQMFWAVMAWPGNALVPVAWCFFVFAYVEGATWPRSRSASATLVAVPGLSFLLAATNAWHGLVYTGETGIPPGDDRVYYAHGPAFYAIIATLYLFVAATLVCLWRGFRRARRSAWSMLVTLVLITISPLLANTAYIVLDLTVFGIDPTAPMFTFGILVFTWMLLNRRSMDMAAAGQSTLFDTMSEPVVLFDRRKRVVMTNAAARRCDLSLGAPDVLSRLGQDSDGAAAAQITRGDRVFELRVHGIENDLNPADGPLGWSATFVDITDRIEASKALEEALVRAEEAVRTKDNFVSVVSHELRTPLTSLKAGLDMALSDRLGTVSPAIRNSLEIAQRGSVRLARLVDNLLLAQKIDADALSLEEEPIELGRLLAESLAERHLFAAERGVRLTQTGTAEPSFIIGDAFAVRQVIDNLLSNAIKFSNAQGEVEGRLERAGGKVRLSITDSGRGIPDGMEDTVFGRFAQVPHEGQSWTQGSGLGLHISRKLAIQMGGDLRYASRLGAGTTFTLEFEAVEQSVARPVSAAGC